MHIDTEEEESEEESEECGFCPGNAMDICSCCGLPICSACNGGGLCPECDENDE